MGQKTLKSTLCRLRSSQTFWARISAERRMGRQLVTRTGQLLTAISLSMYTSETMRHSAGMRAHSKTERIVWKIISSLGILPPRALLVAI